MDLLNYLTPEEQRIRKFWLIYMLISWTIGLVAMLKAAWGSQIEINLLAAVVGLITLGMVFSFQYVIYHCAYKKYGTKLLLLFIIFGCISFPLEVVRMIISPKATNIILDVTMVLFSLVGLFFNIKLRSINKKIKTSLVKA